MVVRPSAPSAPAGTDPARSFRSPCPALRPLPLPPCSGAFFAFRSPAPHSGPCPALRHLLSAPAPAPEPCSFPLIRTFLRASVPSLRSSLPLVLLHSFSASLSRPFCRLPIRPGLASSPPPLFPDGLFFGPATLLPFALPLRALPVSPFAHAEVSAAPHSLAHPAKGVSRATSAPCPTFTPGRTFPPVRLPPAFPHPAERSLLSDFHPPAALPHPPALPPSAAPSATSAFLLWANRRACVPPRPCVQVLLFKMP